MEHDPVVLQTLNEDGRWMDNQQFPSVKDAVTEMRRRNGDPVTAVAHRIARHGATVAIQLGPNALIVAPCPGAGRVARYTPDGFVCTVCASRTPLAYEYRAAAHSRRYAPGADL